MEIEYGAIGQRIRGYRLAFGLSQKIVSEKADLTLAHCRHIERGNTKPSLPTLIRIVNVLGISITSSGDSSMPRNSQRTLPPCRPRKRFL